MLHTLSLFYLLLVCKQRLEWEQLFRFRFDVSCQIVVVFSIQYMIWNIKKLQDIFCLFPHNLGNQNQNQNVEFSSDFCSADGVVMVVVVLLSCWEFPISSNFSTCMEKNKTLPSPLCQYYFFNFIIVIIY